MAAPVRADTARLCWSVQVNLLPRLESFALPVHASYNDPFDFRRHFGYRIHEIHPHQGSAGA
jgi:hypothetical protein